MSVAVVHAVFELLELRTTILSNCLSPMPFYDALRRAHELKRVCRNFQSTMTFIIHQWFTLCGLELDAMNTCVKMYREKQCAWSVDPNPHQTEEYKLLREHAFWADALYDQQGEAFRNVHWINQLDWYRHPQTVEEMTRQSFQHCYVCGTRCKTVLNSSTMYPPLQAMRDARRAMFLHPYLGEVMPCWAPGREVAKAPCGCTQHFVARSILPHTHADELVESWVEFREGEYFLCPMLDIQETLQERHMLNFLRAARDEPWFKLRLMRLFAMRPEAVQPCKHARMRRKRYNDSFQISLPLFAPAIDLGPDSSYAQVFGLTDKEMRRLIGIGGRMRKEERLLIEHRNVD